MELEEAVLRQDQSQNQSQHWSGSNDSSDLLSSRYA